MKDKKIYKKGITAFLPVFNEEKRIVECLTTLQLFDKVILLDKKSTDNTVELASTFENVKILYQANSAQYNSEEFKIFMEECQTEWCIVVTASDIIHFELANEIINVLKKEIFDYDTISIPYKPYMLGQYDKMSPWYAEYSNKIVKMNSVKIDFQSVHAVFLPSQSKVYKIKLNNPEAAYYHLTHENAQGLLDRYIRYWKGEANSSTPLSTDFFYILKKLFQLIFIKRSFFKGKNGIALSFSFLSYFMMAYVVKWDKNYGNASDTYYGIKQDILKKWKLNE